jgi:hypothetical protein
MPTCATAAPNSHTKRPCQRLPCTGRSKCVNYCLRQELIPTFGRIRRTAIGLPWIGHCKPNNLLSPNSCDSMEQSRVAGAGPNRDAAEHIYGLNSHIYGLNSQVRVPRLGAEFGFFNPSSIRTKRGDGAVHCSGLFRVHGYSISGSYLSKQTRAAPNTSAGSAGRPLRVRRLRRGEHWGRSIAPRRALEIQPYRNRRPAGYSK